MVSAYSVSIPFHPNATAKVQQNNQLCKFLTKKNALCWHKCCFFGKKLPVAGYCDSSFEVGRLRVGVLEGTTNIWNTQGFEQKKVAKMLLLLKILIIVYVFWSERRDSVYGKTMRKPLLNHYLPLTCPKS